ncbi:TRAP transporter small permease [Psychrobacter sp. FDAARGOS_221]|uniref:TRAP transporter small permease n=1 Tax=Psychrobacter sp. FDAARGOS_221 TaxID=1975705 RepID=UPI000BB58F75|nr:TRAP transporter small permease [Psychrobacter sp. FDAARGOS_221]PNK61022.1 TRAP transporter small permease [Psychrobacter sp. FDAARGOS_221]
MSFLNDISRFLARICEFIGGISLVVIVLVTVADVIMRYLFKLTAGDFGFTIKGTVEIVSYMMLFGLLAAFAAFVERAQVIVDVFTQRMSHSLKAYMMAFFMLGFFALGLMFVWGLYESALDAAEYGKVTQDLTISMTPIYGFSAVISAMLAVRALIESINIFKTGEFYDAEETGA